MLQAVMQAARRLLLEFGRRPVADAPPLGRPVPEHLSDRLVYRPLERLVLSDEVSRTLFEEYEAHRQGPRGDEETGWLLLGHRREKEAVALATLPAGTRSEAGIAHVRFNSEAQAVASRMVRRLDRQLGIVGVVHTHPGSLRHPSSGDYEGDRNWIRLLRGGEGVFGIGTADGNPAAGRPLGDRLGDFNVAVQPKAHCQCYRGHRLTWYALGKGDRRYRPLPAAMTIGPDLARPLHAAWQTLEIHAERLELLFRRLASVQVEVLQKESGAALEVTIPLDPPDNFLRLVLRHEEVEYFVFRDGQWLAGDNREPLIDRGVYLMLAALAAKEQKT